MTPRVSHSEDEGVQDVTSRVSHPEDEGVQDVTSRVSHSEDEGVQGVTSCAALQEAQCPNIPNNGRNARNTLPLNGDHSADISTGVEEGRGVQSARDQNDGSGSCFTACCHLR